MNKQNTFIPVYIIIILSLCTLYNILYIYTKCIFLNSVITYFLCYAIIIIYNKHTSSIGI